MTKKYYLLFSLIAVFIILAVGILAQRAYLTDAFFEYQRVLEQESFNTQQ